MSSERLQLVDLYGMCHSQDFFFWAFLFCLRCWGFFLWDIVGNHDALTE